MRWETGILIWSAVALPGWFLRIARSRSSTRTLISPPQEATFLGWNCPRNTLEKREMKTRGEDLIFKNESYAIARACFAVYRENGCGFPEAADPEFSVLFRVFSRA